MNKNVVETITGAIVLIVAAAFLFFAYRGSDMGLKGNGTYMLKAKFSDASGIQVGTDVRIGGIKVGIISDMKLDNETYEAIALMSIVDDKKIPSDSSAAIVSSGLLGDKFVQITPGGDDAMLKDGGEIEFTQSSISFEELIGKFVFSGGGVDSETPASN